MDSNDIVWRNAASGEPDKNQLPVSHEFGHTFGNVPQHGHGDEYRHDPPFASPHLGDRNSIMNAGNSLRPRHFGQVLNALGDIAPDTRFTISLLR